jgi:hypothetical protein
MRVRYDIGAVITAVADRDPADEVLAALSYHYFQLGAGPLGDPHPAVDLVAGGVISSRHVGGRVFEVRVRVQAAAYEDVLEERVRKAVTEKVEEALDERADGQITGFTAVNLVIESITPAGRDG